MTDYGLNRLVEAISEHPRAHFVLHDLARKNRKEIQERLPAGKYRARWEKDGLSRSSQFFAFFRANMSEHLLIYLLILSTCSSQLVRLVRLVAIRSLRVLLT
jgi:hypothetical protein